MQDVQVISEQTLSVRDNGIGVPREKQHLIFEAFSRADSSQTRKYGGTGLGLSICAQLCELMGGSIGLASNEGLGSTFWCLLPFRLAKPSVDTASRPQALHLTSPRKREEILRDMPVLLAEDEFINTTLAVELLEHAGLKGQTAGNGREAVTAWQEGAFAAILMDIQMPEMNGLEAAQRIRRLEETTDKHCCIIAVSGTEYQAEDCRKAGMDDFIGKPLSEKKLQQALDNMTKKRKLFAGINRAA